MIAGHSATNEPAAQDTDIASENEDQPSEHEDEPILHQMFKMLKFKLHLPAYQNSFR